MAPLPSPVELSTTVEDVPDIRRITNVADAIKACQDATTAPNKRRQQLVNKNLLLIQGGWLAGKRQIFERLHKLGVKVTLLDTSSKYDWYALVKDGIIEHFLDVDVEDPVDLYERCMRKIRDSPSGGKFDGCCTYYEEAVVLCARIAKELGLDVNPVEAFEKSRNKRMTREAMANADLATPRFAKILRREELEAACEMVGFPAVLKPSLGSGSFGVMPVHSKEDVYSKYDTLVGWMDPEEDPVYKEGKEIILEEFYDGDEFDIDVILGDSEVTYAKVSDNWPCTEGYFKESGTNCPSIYPAERQAELIDLATSTVKALGFCNGVFHVEAKYTSSGARILEVNARMGGYAVRDVNLYAWGVDLIEEHAMNALRIPGKPEVLVKPRTFIAECGLSAPYSGIVNKNKWLDHIKSDPRILQVNYWKRSGDTVRGPEDCLPSIVIEILAVSDKSVEEACQVIIDVVKSIGEPPITPKRAGVTMKFHVSEDGHPFDMFKLCTKSNAN